MSPLPSKHLRKRLDPPSMKRKRNADSPYARLDPSARGVIWGMYLAKATREDILKHVVEKDDATSLAARRRAPETYLNPLIVEKNLSRQSFDVQSSVQSTLNFVRKTHSTLKRRRLILIE